MAAVAMTGDREELVKSQGIAVAKAINALEAPLKEKHARTLIMGTHKEKGGGLFWNHLIKMQLEANPFLSWKFCHILHKLIRDGHPNFLSDSLKYRSKIADLGRLWGHLKTSYGPLIQLYCKVLVNKLQFHQRNPRIPGSLALTDAQLNAVGETDVNEWFDLTVQMLDYIDEIIAFEKRVFESMEVARISSMSRVGQCRLAPLILCILDSNALYDYIVKMMFKLHSSLPPDFLVGHRQRFNDIFPQLNRFYQTSRNLQYFRYLISIPTLPSDPPDFLRASAFDDYVTPQARLLEGSDSPPDSVSLAGDHDGMLVDLSAPQPPPTPTPVIPVQQPAWVDLEADRNREKDHLILTLQHDLEDSKGAIQQMQSRYKSELGEYQRRILQLEHEISSAKLTVEQVSEECERYRIQAESLQNEKNQQITNQNAQANYTLLEEKFKKMKDAYVKLRQEHIDVLKGVKEAELKKDALLSDKAILDEKVAKIEQDVARLKVALERTESALAEALAGVADRCNHVTLDTIEQYDNPAHMPAQCSPEYVLSRMRNVMKEVEQIQSGMDRSMKGSGVDPDVIPSLASFTCILNEALLCSKAVANGARVSQAEQLVSMCQNVSGVYGRFLSGARTKDGWPGAKAALIELQVHLKELESCLNECLGKMDTDIESDELGSLIEKEMKRMDAAIEEAVSKIQSMMTQRKVTDSGVKLEVNEGILDSCSALMQAILALIRRARDLQQEIVSQGRGTGSVQEFYKKHHQWTEGLISAAKAVGSGAQILLTCADQVVSGEGKFETLIVASQEIAASTAQLVMASRVKAEPSSEHLHSLQLASRNVASSTANVVATTKAGAESLQEQDLYNFSQDLNLHKAKKLEMESKVRVLELESLLQKERAKLAEIRKKHYELAGPSAGWEDVNGESESQAA